MSHCDWVVLVTRFDDWLPRTVHVPSLHWLDVVWGDETRHAWSSCDQNVIHAWSLHRFWRESLRRSLRYGKLPFGPTEAKYSYGFAPLLRIRNSLFTTCYILIAFMFLFLNIPARSMVFYLNFSRGGSAFYYAGLHLFHQVGEKAYFTNNGINFYLYVTDLKNLFVLKK